MIWVKRLNTYGISNWVILLLFILSLFSIIAQMVGLGIFLPIFEYIFQGDSAQTGGDQNVLLKYINLLITSMNISVSLESLLITAFVFYLISQISLFIIAYANSFFLGWMMKDIRDKFFTYYLDADSEYYDQVKIGDFINISTSELRSAVHGVITPIRLMVSLVSAIGSFIILMMLSYELTFYIVLIIAVMLPYPVLLISRATKVGRKNTKFNSILVSFLLDRLRSPRLVRLSGTRNAEIKEYFSLTDMQRNLTLKIHLLKEKIGLTFEPAIIFSALVILYVAITYLGMSSSSVLLFMIITVRLVPIIRAILVQKQSINRSKGAMESIDFLIAEMKVKDKSGDFFKHEGNDVIDINSIKGIQLEDVSYRYSGVESDSLSNISLAFKRGTINAIIGSSGSGKSTLIDIISSYRKPSKGKIYFDGLITSEFKINSLISYVPQQPQIFDGPVVEHISYGLIGKSSTDIMNASKLSGAHDFIMSFDNQYQTVLNNNGGNLSGGQRYKIDMTRALLSNTPILILDEPTSALDYESKDNFIKTLKRIQKETNKIIIVITHDFSIMQVFDSIVLLESGKKVAQLTHTELKKVSPWYAKGIKSNIEEFVDG